MEVSINSPSGEKYKAEDEAFKLKIEAKNKLENTLFQ